MRKRVSSSEDELELRSSVCVERHEVICSPFPPHCEPHRNFKVLFSSSFNLSS